MYALYLEVLKTYFLQDFLCYLGTHCIFIIFFLCHFTAIRYFKGKIDRTNISLRLYRSHEYSRLVNHTFQVYFDFDPTIQRRFEAYVFTFRPDLKYTMYRPEIRHMIND